MVASSIKSLRKENEELRLRLEEAEETLRAIRSGEVDSLVVEGTEGPRVFVLEGMNHSYRVLVEAMSEGAVSLNASGAILYCNSRFAALLDAPLAQVMGSSIYDVIDEAHRAIFDALLKRAGEGESRGEVSLRSRKGEVLPTLLSISPIEDAGRRVLCLLATDLREQKRNEELLAAAKRSVLEQTYQEKLRRMAFDAAQCEERERRRIAVDLHDHVGQSLALAHIKLTSLGDEVEGEVRMVLAQAVELLARCSVEMHSLVFDLSPPVLHDLGMMAALGWLVEELHKRDGLHVELTDDGSEKPLDEVTAGLVFRAVRELLMNVFKHARTSSATVSLGRIEDELEIQVRDAGVGFDPEVLGPALGGFGLFSVREQIRSLGGTVVITSAPNLGTSIALRVPLKPRDPGGPSGP